LENIKNKFFNERPLFTQIGITALAFLAMFVLSYLFTSNIVREHLERNTENALTSLQAKIESDLHAPRITLLGFSETVRSKVLLGATSTDLEAYILRISESLFRQDKPMPSFQGFYAYIKTFPDGPAFIDGTIGRNAVNLPKDFDPTQRPWYLAAIAGGGSVVESPRFIDAATGEIVFAFVRSIYDVNDSLIGVVGFNMKIDDIGGYVIETALTHGGYGMLIDKDFTVLAHPCKELVGNCMIGAGLSISMFAGELAEGEEIFAREAESFKGERSIVFFRIISNGRFLGIVMPKTPYYRSVTNMALVLGALGFTLAFILIGILVRIDAARVKSDKESKYKSAFLANMSHEIRTPMSAIIGMTTVGKNASNIEKKDYCFSKIEDASKHLLGVINDVLDMSKIEANKLELSLELFDFEKMLQRVVNVINFRASEKNQNLSVRIDKSIPKKMVGDDQRLAQVITNLLSNATKFTPENGKICLDTRLLSEEDGSCLVQFRVSDNGIGISKEQQEKLFRSFQQADSDTSRKFGGTGLGLSISKSIVEMMGGEVGLESELGKGSTFIFTVRMARGDSDEHTTLLRGVNWSNVRVLAVDDDESVLTYFREIMQGFGVNCDVATCSREALSIVAQNGAYNIYFVDWKMPEIDGIALTEKLKASGYAEPDKSIVIMISSAKLNTIEDVAKKAGVSKFLPKPLFPSAIMDLLNEILEFQPQQATIVQKASLIDGCFKDYHILLAEDVKVNSEIALALLEPTLLKIDCAENGLEAVDMFAKSPEKYDLIFMDLQMPEMDGYQATKRIRAMNEIENAKKIPIIAMTANVFREDIERCLEAGMNAHIGKPLDFDEVIEKLRKYLPKKA